MELESPAVHAAWQRSFADQVHTTAHTVMVLRCYGSWHVFIALILQWVLIGVVAWGSQVILPSPTSLRTLECMLCQAKGRSQYVSPMGFPSGAYALGSHFATGPSRLGSHWLSLLGVSWGVDQRTPAVMAGASGPRKIGHTPWPATNQPTNQTEVLEITVKQ